MKLDKRIPKEKVWEGFLAKKPSLYNTFKSSNNKKLFP